MALTCASARVGLCIMVGAPIPLITGGNKTGPRHGCTMCRFRVHGNGCGIQLSDEEQLKQKGIPVPFDISCLPPEGQAEMKSFNNDGCILCHACASDIISTEPKSHAQRPDTTATKPKPTAAVAVANAPPRTPASEKVPAKDSPCPSSTENSSKDSEDDLRANAVFANRKEDQALEWSCVKVHRLTGRSWVHDHCYAVSIDKTMVCYHFLLQRSPYSTLSHSSYFLLV